MEQVKGQRVNETRLDQERQTLSIHRCRDRRRKATDTMK